MKNTLLYADKAILKSKQNAVKIGKTKEKVEREYNKQLEKDRKRELNLYKKQIKATVYKEINREIKEGNVFVNIILDRSWNVCFENKMFKFDGVIDDIIKELKNKNYEVYYGPIQICHDETAAYLNSGGECGRSEIWYSTELVLSISWKSKLT